MLDDAQLEHAKIVLGEKMREYRKARHWSQEKLAEQCDLHWTYIGAIERAERNLSFTNFLKIAYVIELDWHDLVN